MQFRSPLQPKVPLYKAKYGFEGQEGELSLKKDDILELVKKEDNGWWLMKKDGAEGWAPENYLELVPPKAEPAAPPPPPRSTAPKAPPAPGAANATARPVAVFPGVAANGASSTPPLKKINTAAAKEQRVLNFLRSHLYLQQGGLLVPHLCQNQAECQSQPPLQAN